MKTFWDWVISFFNRKPKELPAYKPCSPEPVSDPLQTYGLDHLDRMVLSLNDEKVEFERETREKIHKGDYFKRAFVQQMEYVRQPAHTMIITNIHLILTEKEFPIFSEEFIEVCLTKGIVCKKYTNTSIEIGMQSFLEYVQRCKDKIKKSDTITQGPYR